MKFFKHKMILSLWIASFIILGLLYYFIPYITKKNVHMLLVDNAQQMVQQMKLTRSYYLENIVNDIQKHSKDFNFVAMHQKNPEDLPLPSTLIHDLSILYTKETGVGFRTYSAFPFKNRETRKLSEQDKKVLKNIHNSQNGIYVFEVNDEEPTLHIAVADYMENISCINCHNNHPNRTWSSNKWKVGDIRGVIEISTPLKKSLIQLNQIKMAIMGSILFLGIILVVYYSILFLKREDELLEINKEQEQILIQKSKLSSMGEMLNNISHQWREPLSELSTVLMHIDIKHQNQQLDRDFMENKMKKAEKILDYLSDTIDDFKNFFAPVKSKEHFSLLETVNRTLQIYDLGTKIEIKVDIPKEFYLFGFQTELSQVILNIISNAKEAHAHHNTKNPFISIYAKAINTTITLYIEDNAGGIDSADIHNIFDLYYTNKINGSGIGLYMSILIIKKHFEGNLSVKNTNHGVYFSIKFPQVSTTYHL